MAILHRLLSSLLVVILLVSAFFGFAASPNTMHASNSLLQWLVAVSELLYAVTACGALWLMYRRDARQTPVLIVFSLAVTVTSGLAPVVWGHASWRIGAMSALAAVALVGGVLAGRQQIAKRLQQRDARRLK